MTLHFLSYGRKQKVSLPPTPYPPLPTGGFGQVPPAAEGSQGSEQSSSSQSSEAAMESLKQEQFRNKRGVLLNQGRTSPHPENLGSVLLHFFGLPSSKVGKLANKLSFRPDVLPFN